MNRDFYGLESVEGFVHMISIDDDGNKVAVAYATEAGMRLVVFAIDTFRKANAIVSRSSINETSYRRVVGTWAAGSDTHSGN